MMLLASRAARLIALLLSLLVAGPSYALDYPTRPVRFIVSFAAGGPNDTIARLLGQYLAEQLGQAVVVEDHVGAGGNIGMQDVLNSTPDGYTIGFVAPNNAINQTLYQNIPFDFVRDSTPIAGVMSLANVMEENLAFRPRASPSSSPWRRPSQARSTSARAGWAPRRTCRANSFRR
jgi:tripartite-type tricarboxylate transporter receptor subunit TctC